MGILKLQKHRVALRIFASLFLMQACSDGKVVQVIPIELDTYIDSQSNADNSASRKLYVSKSASREQRAFLKIPSGNQDESMRDYWLDGEIDNPVEVVLLPFYITFAMMYALLGIGAYDPDRAAIELNSTNLQSSVLSITFDSAEAATAAHGQITLQLLSRSWFPTCTWQRAHHFSQTGPWTSQGGDIDTSLSVIGLQTGGPTSNEIEFDIEPYMARLIDEEQLAHFGFVLRTVNDGVNVNFNSSNAGSGYPSITSVYTLGGSLIQNRFELRSQTMNELP